MDLNLFLSTVNGAWTIQLLLFIAFLLYYLWEARHRFHFKDLFINQPRAVQVAIAILIADVGNVIVRGAVWFWRETGVLEPMAPPWLVATVSIGAAIGTIGILCKMRVFTLQRFGHWPWAACAATVVLFVLARLALA